MKDEIVVTIAIACTLGTAIIGALGGLSHLVSLWEIAEALYVWALLSDCLAGFCGILALCPAEQ